MDALHVETALLDRAARILERQADLADGDTIDVEIRRAAIDIGLGEDEEAIDLAIKTRLRMYL